MPVWPLMGLVVSFPCDTAMILLYDYSQQTS
jgi:hypothetical protein